MTFIPSLFNVSFHTKLLKLVYPPVPVPDKIYVAGSVGKSIISVILQGLAIRISLLES